MALRVKCKGCGADAPCTPNDPPKSLPDGGHVFAATCPACGSITHYRRPEVPAPAASPLADLDMGTRTAPRESQVMRLPAIVLKAAWWVRLTLMVMWILLATLLALNIVGFAYGYYMLNMHIKSQTAPSNH